MEEKKWLALRAKAVEEASKLVATIPFVAEMVCKQLLRCEPENPDGLELLGLAKHRLGKHVEAIEVIQTAIEVNPDSAENHNNIALAYACIDEFDRAITHLEKALELSPDNYLFMNNLAFGRGAFGRGVLPTIWCERKSRTKVCQPCPRQCRVSWLSL